MATTTAIVTSDGLALTPEFMAELNLQPGTQITVSLIVPEKPREVSQDVKRQIRETRGMFASSGGGMAEELMEQRREEERRFQAKKW